MINIPKNTYSIPTEIREEIVQDICTVFLDRRGGNYYNIFHPTTFGLHRNKTLYLIYYKNSNKPFCFGSKNDCSDGEKAIRIRGCEMKQAFKELQKAGYYMFSIYEYHSWLGYICHNKPFYDKGTLINDFTDFID